MARPAPFLGAWIVTIASIGVFLAAPLVAPAPDPLAVLVFGAAATSSVLVGMVLIARATGNRVGPLLLLAGSLLALAYGLGLYSDAGAAATPAWPGVELAWVLGDALFVFPIVIVLVGIPLIFPDGRLISPRWRAVVWLVVAAMIAQTVSTLTSPSSSIQGVDNPLAVPGLQSLDAVLLGFSSATSVVGFGAAAAAVWIRYRRGNPVERQQLKWLLAVAALSALFLPAAFIVPNQDIAYVAFLAGALTLVALPIAIAIAILRYRLYEIDRIISRTIAYTIVSLVLLAVFGAAVLILSTALASFASGQTVAVAGATLVAYALFQPVLRRIRRDVDRRFDRARYDGERTAAAFSERLRDETDLAAVTNDLSTTIRAALAPAALGVWIRGEPVVMVRWVTRVAALAGFAALVLTIVVDAAVDAAGQPYVLYGGIAAAFVAVGWLITERRPGNAVGPLLLVFGVVFAAWVPADLYLSVAQDMSGHETAGDLVALFATAIDAPMFVLVGLTLVLFPDGRLPSPRWRPILYLAAASIASVAIGYALDPDPFPIYPDYGSPFGIPGFPGEVLVYAGYTAMLVVLASGAAALVSRWRRHGPIERTQIKWVAAAGIVVLAAELVNVATFDPTNTTAPINMVATVTIVLIPIAVGIAILRYHLYEIDRIVSRTIAYAVVTLVVLAAFGAAMLLLSAALASFASGQTIAVAGATLVAYALFQPVLRRIRRHVDHRFDRARYDGERTAAAFSERLRDETDIEAVTADLGATVQAAMQPTALGLWVR